MDELSGYECKNYRFMVRKRLASGGGQQIPIFSALGAECTVLDYSSEQCGREREIALSSFKESKTV